MQLIFKVIVKITLQTIILLSANNIPISECASCQCTCTSDNAPSGGGGKDPFMPPGGGDGGGGGNGGGGSEPDYGSEMRALPADKRFCARTAPSKCICYEHWKRDMDRVIYGPCLEGCNQWNNYYNQCKTRNPDKTMEWYAYNCPDCNLKNNYLDQCVNKAGGDYVDLLVKTANENSIPFNSLGC